MQYTDDQRKAIEERGRNILVAAAAGSGKTRVLVDRIIMRLLKRECSVDQLLVVTFTNAAAAEMRERIEKALQKRLLEAEDQGEAAWLDRQSVLLTGASISTFHVFCQKVIRQNIEAVEVDPQFRLASEQEMVLMKRDVLENLLEEHYHEPERENYGLEEEYQAAKKGWQEFLAFADDYGNDHGDEAVYDAVLRLYEFSQSQPEPEVWLQRQADRFAVEDGADIWQSEWGKELWQNIESRRRGLKSQAEDFSAWLKEGAAKETEVLDRAALEAALQPYGEVLETTRASLEDILLAGKDWQQISSALDNFKAGRLTAAKVFRPLKEEYPSLRAGFDVRHQALKDAVKAMQSDYFRYSEEETLAMLAECGPTVCRYTQLVLDFISALRLAKQERNVLDFNDLEHYALQILCGDREKLTQETPVYVPSEVALSLQEKFVEVMVDEYQDTNSVQEAILSLVARPCSRFTVGDVKQSIYRFRLANPYLFQRQYEAYPLTPQEGDKDQLITMRQNFRSRSEVLAPINFIFDQIMHRDPMEIEYDEQAKLYPGAKYPEEKNILPSGVDVDLILAGGTSEGQEENEEGEELAGFALEAQRIAERIAKLIAAGHKVYDGGKYRPIMYRDIAVLLRAVKGKADILLEVLRKNSIPAYADVSGGYFEAHEVRLVLDLLSIIDNARQDIPLAAVLASPLGGFSMEELSRIRLSSEEENLYGALLGAQEVESGLPGELEAKAAAFQEKLAGWRSFVVSHSVPELIWKLYRETGYYDYVGSLPGGLLRQANLRMLADRAADYEKTNYRGLFRFLRFMGELKKRETDLSTARTLGESENVVRIMSIHKSKGLEFPVVFVADLGKQFNMMDARGTFLFHQELGIGPQLVERSKTGRQQYQTLPWKLVQRRLVSEAKAEEMRVLYVAMTRAREKLILTGTVKADEEKFVKLAAGWCKGVGSDQQALPADMLGEAVCVLDWLMPSLARHADGRLLREKAGLAESLQSWSLDLEPEARFNLQMIPSSDIHVQEICTGEHNPVLELVQQGKPLPDTEHRAVVRERLGWHYDYRGLEQVPAKVTVTELKSRSHEAAIKDDAYPAVPWIHKVGDGSKGEPQGDWRRPLFLQRQEQGRQRLTATERGTLMHTALQHLDFGAEGSFAAVKEQLEKMEALGILQPGESRAIDAGKIAGFLVSPLGERLRSARHIYRELPFSRLLPADRFYDQVKEEKASIFLQGVVDLLFEDKDGRLVLVDYKTDWGLDEQQARARYQLQINMYREAAEAILSRQVEESYLYLLQNGLLVSL